MPQKSWTGEELRILRKTYPLGVAAAMAALPQFPKGQIKTAAQRRGIRVSDSTRRAQSRKGGKSAIEVRKRLAKAPTTKAVLSHYDDLERMALFLPWGGSSDGA